MDFKIFRRLAFLFAVAGVIILVDQITKAYVREHLALYEMWAPWPWLMPYARFVHITNTGVAFGMFQNMGAVFAVLAVIVSLGIIYYFPNIPERDWPLRLALGMQLGGALGNLLDRLTQNWAVTDFISVGNFAVFNIADASISVGVVVLVWGVWLQERRQKREAAALAQASPEGDPPGRTGELDSEISSSDSV